MRVCGSKRMRWTTVAFFLSVLSPPGHGNNYCHRKLTIYPDFWLEDRRREPQRTSKYQVNHTKAGVWESKTWSCSRTLEITKSCTCMDLTEMANQRLWALNQGKNHEPDSRQRSDPKSCTKGTEFEIILIERWFQITAWSQPGTVFALRKKK